MSATSHPITREFFLQAIRELELEQLHAEAARLELSLYHLRRSQVQLEEFKDDPVCQAAIEDNEVVIKNQIDRIGMIRLEVERRGFTMEHGAGAGTEGVLVNGSVSIDQDDRENSLGPEVEMGGTREQGPGASAISARAAVEGNSSITQASTGRHENANEEEGVYL